MAAAVRVARQYPRAAERHRAGRHSVERRAPSSRYCAAACTWRHRLRQLTFRRRPRRCHSHRPRVPRSRADESDEGARACRWPDLWSGRRGRTAWGQSDDSRLTSARAQDQDEQDALIPGVGAAGPALSCPGATRFHRERLTQRQVVAGCSTSTEQTRRIERNTRCRGRHADCATTPRGMHTHRGAPDMNLITFATDAPRKGELRNLS